MWLSFSFLKFRKFPSFIFCTHKYRRGGKKGGISRRSNPNIQIVFSKTNNMIRYVYNSALFLVHVRWIALWNKCVLKIQCSIVVLATFIRQCCLSFDYVRKILWWTHPEENVNVYRGFGGKFCQIYRNCSFGLVHFLFHCFGQTEESGLRNELDCLLRI